MLWKQETNSTLYVDIIKNASYVTDFHRLNDAKNNTISSVARSAGNEKYGKGDYKGAITFYNKGLCYAENFSEFLSLCYCNRSMCFLQLGLYDKCLADIHLARNSNCPDASIKKLELREKKCLEMLAMTKHSSEILSSVDYGELPFSSALIIEKKPKFGRTVVAQNHIQMGDVLVAEKNYVRTEKSIKFDKCSTCSSVNKNFVPCENCSGAMYCDRSCETKNSFHEFECSIVLATNHCCDGLHLPFILRSIIVGINSFEKMDEMMECVANWTSSDPLEIIESTTSPISKYKAFFKLSTVKPQHQVLRFRKSAFMILNSALKSTKFSSIFQTTAEQRFLAHLVVHHCGITQTNSFGESLTNQQDEFSDTISNEYCSISIDLISSYFNHSCTPNVVRLESGSLTVIKAISPIKAGEQMFLTYLEAFDMDRNERKNQLENVYGFSCECKLCIYGIMKVEGLENDRVFLQICNESAKITLDYFDIEKISKLKELCIEFVKKNPNYNTSRETNYVKDVFGECLRRLLIQH